MSPLAAIRLDGCHSFIRSRAVFVRGCLGSGDFHTQDEFARLARMYGAAL